MAPSWTAWWSPRPGARAEAWQDFQSLVAWILGLQLLDLLTTLGALANGAAEGNPLASGILASSGAAGLVQLKVAALLLCLGWLPAFAGSFRLGDRNWATQGMLGVLAALSLFYCAIVFHNLAVLNLHLGA